MADLRDELDASVEFGSGYISLFGPPSCGKTTMLLDYLVAREACFLKRVASTDGSEGPSGGSFLMEYVSARSLEGDALRRLSSQFASKPTRRRLQSDYTPLQFGHNVEQWIEEHGSGSELHLVLDDADILADDADQMNGWLSGCVSDSVMVTSTVCLWVVSQLPLRLPNCFRFHFVAPPSVDVVCRWLEHQYTEQGDLFRHSPSPCGGDAASQAVVLTPAQTNALVVEAIHYYATHQPMMASVVCKDVRRLLHRVYQLLPALVAVSGMDTESPVETVKLNAIHFATAWSKLKAVSAQERDGQGAARAGGASDPLVNALQCISYSAVLLAFAAFYCGAVPKHKLFDAFSSQITDSSRGAKPTGAKAHSHKAEVLSSSCHTVTTPRLMLVYEAMLRICVQHIDATEFASPEVAVHYIHGFITWGVLTPVAGQKNTSFHCWLPVSTALRLGDVLSLNLYDLIPT